MFTTKSAVLIILGAYYTPTSLAPFIARLEEQGYVVVCPAPATNGDAARPPLKSLADDAAIIKSAAQDLITTNHRILVLAHSYGGCVANTALTPDLLAPTPESPGIVHLTYLAAFVPLPGESMLRLLELFGWRSALDVSVTDGIATLQNPVAGLWNDSAPSDVQSWAAQLTTFNFGACSVNVPCAPWTGVASTYIVCKADQAIFADMQAGVVKRMREFGEGPRGVEVVEIESAHCPFQTQLEGFLDTLRGVWGGIGVGV